MDLACLEYSWTWRRMSFPLSEEDMNCYENVSKHLPQGSPGHEKQTACGWPKKKGLVMISFTDAKTTLLHIAFILGFQGSSVLHLSLSFMLPPSTANLSCSSSIESTCCCLQCGEWLVSSHHVCLAWWWNTIHGCLYSLFQGGKIPLTHLYTSILCWTGSKGSTYFWTKRVNGNSLIILF